MPLSEISLLNNKDKLSCHEISLYVFVYVYILIHNKQRVQFSLVFVAAYFFNNLGQIKNISLLKLPLTF